MADQEEIWKNIVGYERYKVSNTGKVVNSETNKELSQTDEKDGMMVALRKDGNPKKFAVSRLVATYFVENLHNDMIVMQRNRDYRDNKASNLMWVSRTKMRHIIMQQKISDFDMSKINSLPGEEWKTVSGYSNHMVSNMGRVLNKETSKFLKPNINGGYYIVMLCDPVSKKRNSLKVHRIVAMEFVHNPDPKTKTVVDHASNNKLENAASNLRWVSQKENIHHYVKNHKKETGRGVFQYDGDTLIKRWSSMSAVLKENPSFSDSTLRSSIRLSKLYKGYRWEFDDSHNKKHENHEDEEGEEYKNIGIIDGFDCSNYAVSNYGKIRNVITNKMMTPIMDLDGYHFVHLRNKAEVKHKRMFVHRLVALLFVPGRTKERNIVNHLSEVKTNNRADQLEWTSYKENVQYSIGKRVNQIDPQTNEIIRIHSSIADASKYKCPEKECAPKYGISRCCHGKQKLYAGYKWEFADKLVPKALEVEHIDAPKLAPTKPATKRPSTKRPRIRLIY